jgi:hydroxymethylglutaryl-CoA lyase
LAFDSGSRFLAFVLSVSESHNRSNVKRSPIESVKEFRSLLAAMPEHIDVRLNIATAFDCPFEGRVAETNTIALLDLLVPMRPEDGAMSV